MCVCVCVCKSASKIDFSTWNRKRKDFIEANKKFIILSYLVRKFCVFERPFSLSVYHLRKVLKSPQGNSLYLDFFYSEREISNLMTHLGQNMLRK